MDELIALLLSLTPLTAENRDKVLPSYSQFFTRLLKFNKKIAEIWELLFRTKIKNDELLPVTIAMLPADPTILEKVMNHADFASLATANSVISFMLTNLYTAASARKYEFKEEKVDDTSEEVKQQIGQVIAEYQRNTLIHKIRDAAKNYKEAIAAAMLEYIRTNEPFYYKKYMETASTVGSAELNIMRFDMTMMADNPALTLLNEKYIVISDMIITLKRKKLTRENILTEFAKKYEQHKMLLQQTDIKVNHLAIAKITGLFSVEKSPLQAAQERFFAISNSFCAIPDLISFLRNNFQ